MTYPRLAAFARLASGNAEPVREIAGQASKLTRVAHGIAYDPVHDEILASEPLASSVVVFPGGATGQVAPKRVIQGSKTKLHDPWQVIVDNAHGEILVADDTLNGILVFPRTANGNVAPLRVVQSRGMEGVGGVAVDPKRNLLFAGSYHYRGGGIFVFHRTDNGDVKPLTVIRGPKTGIRGVWHLAVYRDLLFATVVNVNYIPPYDKGGFRPRKGVTGPALAWRGDPGFVGVWKVTDQGDAAPLAVVRGAATGLLHPSGLALDPSDGDVFATDSFRNGFYRFIVPSFFTAKK